MQKQRTHRANSAVVGLAMVGSLLLGGRQAAQAQSLERITYLGGTTAARSGVHGRISISSPDTLVFEGPSKVTIAYDHVLSYESCVHKKVHVGLLTEGLWRLALPWPESKQLSLSYRDEAEHSQVVVLEMSRADEALLVEVLKTRVPRPGANPRPLGKPTATMQDRASAQ